jgi:KilA-N domain
MLFEICTSQIRDNFWYAFYGSFKVVMNKDDGFINATKLCSLADRKFSDWKCNATSLRLMHAVEDEISMKSTNFTHHTSDLSLKNTVAVNLETVCKTITTSNQTEEDKLISGTYCHPLLIPHIAC